jgi:hypothetical protein
MGLKLSQFFDKYHYVDNPRLTSRLLRKWLAALQYISRFSFARNSAMVPSLQQGGSTFVDLALKLDVLAVFAVFAFVSAILLGAF